MGTGEQVDELLIAMAARCHSRLTKAEASVDGQGQTILTSKGAIIKNPALQIVEKATTQMQRFLSDLGLTPSARAKHGAPNEQDDEFEALRKKRAAA